MYAARNLNLFLDPANDMLIYKAKADISQLITLEDAMSTLSLGPNGGLMYCMEYLEKNMDWLLQQISSHKDYYFLFDCPGQVELYTHHNAVKNITANLVKFGLHLCSVHLVDAHYCSDSDQQCMLRVKNAVDKANGYIFGSGEKRNIQSLLSSAVGAEFEQDRTGFIRDNYSDDRMKYEDDLDDKMMYDDVVA
ncbi:GPN-loop GTPase 2 [Blattella germanica]|nr:GPN-loop GTPase 2 [Blattella germanica]